MARGSKQDLSQQRDCLDLHDVEPSKQDADLTLGEEAVAAESSDGAMIRYLVEP